jgi:hypothetical protein
METGETNDYLHTQVPLCLGECGVQISESDNPNTADLIAQTHADVRRHGVEVTPVNMTVDRFSDPADWGEDAA